MLDILPGEYENDLHVWPLRGNLRSLADLETDFAEIKPGTFKAIMLDTKYRFRLKRGASENDNTAETRTVQSARRDRTSTRGRRWCSIHHSSKGSQTEKRP